MDISTAAAVSAREDEGQVVAIRDVDSGEPTTDTITVAGTYSSRWRKALDRQTQRAIKRRWTKLTPEQIEANRVELVAACILAWEGFTNAGQPFPFTLENAVTLLTRAPWIREQLEEAMADHAGFSPSSAER